MSEGQKTEDRGQKTENGGGRNGAPLINDGKDDRTGRVCGTCSHFNGQKGYDIGKCGDEPVFRSDTCANFDPACGAAVNFPAKAVIERMHAEAHARLGACRGQCQAGGECGRAICTGAYKLAASEDAKRHEVCQAVLADMDKEDLQTVINRLLEGLELIAEMPAYDAEIGLTVNQVASQYEEARETARLTLDQYARNGGSAADRKAVPA